MGKHDGEILYADLASLAAEQFANRNMQSPSQSVRLCGCDTRSRRPARRNRENRGRSRKRCDPLLNLQSDAESLQNPQWKSRLKKDPGIPNLFPFKDKILEEIEEKKRKKAEDAQRLRDVAKANKKTAATTPATGEEVAEDDLMDEDDDLTDDEDEEQQVNEEANSSNPMAALLASAQARATEYEDDDLRGDMASEEDDEVMKDGGASIQQPGTDHRNPDSSRKAFDKIFKQVLEAADVILYVLDARDPDGTRSREVERQIMSADSGSKRLILVLNKIDLVPAPVLKGWLTHLRRSFPTIPLRASTPASNAQTFDHKQLTVRNTSETLLRSLKTYAASKTAQTINLSWCDRLSQRRQVLSHQCPDFSTQ